MINNLQEKTYPIIKCCKCGEIKNRDEFSNDRTKQHGKCTVCKECRSVYKKYHRQLPKSKIKQREYNKRHYRKHTSNIIELKRQYRDIIKTYDLLINAINKTCRKIEEKEKRNLTHQICIKCGVDKPINKFDRNKIRADGSIHYKTTCRECLKPQNAARKKKYSQSIKAKETTKRRRLTIKYKIQRKEKDIRRRHRGIVSQESFTRDDIQYVMNQFDNKCFNCGSTNKLHIDHHYPLSSGNPLTIDNAVVLCNHCNAKKNATFPEYFYSTLQLLLLEVYYNKINKPIKQCNITCHTCGKHIDNIKRKRKRYYCSIECERKHNARKQRERNRLVNNILPSRWRTIDTDKHKNNDIVLIKSTKCA